MSTEPLSPGYWRWHVWNMESVATREALPMVSKRVQFSYGKLKCLI